MPRDYSVTDIAEIFNVSRSTVIKWINDKDLLGFQLPGGNNRIPKDDLTAFMLKYNVPLKYLEEYGQHKILVVDDDQDILNIFKEAFKSEENIAIHTAGSGFEAGMLTTLIHPQIIILDIRLPDIDGRLICKALRKNPQFESVKIIAISGRISEKEAGQLESQGFDGYFKKPFNINEMVEVIRQILIGRMPKTFELVP